MIKNSVSFLPGADLGGGGRMPPLSDSTPCRPNGSTLPLF